MSYWRFVLLFAVFTGSLSAPAHATLGRKAATIENDRVRMLGRKTTQIVQGDVTRHDVILDSETVVSQFTGAEGTVFAVSWQGPVRPNLNQLLGSDYFNRFQADNATNGRIRMRRALASTHSDFVVRTGGHSGAFWGIAFLPKTVPPGFSPARLQAGPK